MGDLIYLRTPSTWNLDASLNKAVTVAPNGVVLAIQLGATNVLNHPVWGTGLGFLQDASVTSTTFGQTTGPQNGARQMYIRAEIRF